MSLVFIKKFIEKLNAGNFHQADYDFNKYDCEMSALKVAICDGGNRDHDEIIDFWNRKQESDYFQMQHPLYNHITTRAVFSIHHKYCNYVFFVDKTNKYIWCGVQTEYAFSWFFCDDTLYTINASWYGYDFSFISDVSCEQLAYKDIGFGFLFNSNVSLWHYFHDSFVLTYELKLRKPLKNSPYYFTPNHVQLTNEELVFLYIGWSIRSYNPLDVQRNAIIKRMGGNIYKDSMANVNNYLQNNDNYDLVVWLGLTYNKLTKTWLGQVDGVVNIIKELQKTFKKIKIYLDGMKAYENKEFYAFHHMSENAKQIISEISSELKDVNIVNLNGYTVKEAVCICSQVDIAIAECGAGAFLPVLFCRKPSVLYGNSRYLLEASGYSQLDEKVKLVDLKYTKSIGFIEDGSWDVRNYHISWQHIYNLMAELLENLSQEKKLKISHLKLERLFVPSVELIAKQYEIKQETGLKTFDENVNEVIKYFVEKELDLQNQIDTLNVNHSNLMNEIQNLRNEKEILQDKLDSFPVKKQHLELANLEQDLVIKKLESKKLAKFLGIKMNVINPKITFIQSNSAKARIQNQLSYKLGQALIENSKSILGYIRMPYVLSYIKDKHQKERLSYETKIKENPNLALPSLETYPDYNEALKEKECFTYKLGEAFIKAHKNWYKGGYIRFYFKDVSSLKKLYKK